MKKFQIKELDKSKINNYQHIIDTKTKPLGALGFLEKIGLQICLIQNTSKPQIITPQMYVFAADHGIAETGVSPFPQEVTAQMVYNFMGNGAAINVFCNQNNIELFVVDSGVKHIDYQVITENNHFIKASLGKGTKNFLTQAAMTQKEGLEAINKGAEILNKNKKNSTIVGFGEMGIGNTSSAALLMHYFTNITLEKCVGRGTGLDDEGLKKKIELLKTSKNNAPQIQNTLEILSYFGGFEINMMVGAMLQAAENKQILLVDGFIATAAFLAAFSIEPLVKEYAIFCHQSDENGHKFMLEYLKVEPILNLNLRLGEGTGCALALPLVQASVNFINQMSSFEQAGIENRV